MVAVAAVRQAVEARKHNKGHTEHTESNGGNSDAEDAPAETIETVVFCHGFWKYQLQARKFYKTTTTEVFVASLIGGNFLMNLIEATIDPQKVLYPDVFGGFELFFNIAFTIELGVNMYAFWLCDFWKSTWNVFDFVVVSIGLLTTLQVPLPGPLKMLRMMRAFRVFRLFKRIKSLKKIMDSLAKAIPGVVNAFVILVLVMCIYSILAVEFWSTYGLGGTITNEDGVVVPLQTSRGQDYGWEYFGNFPKSMYTMFQVLTGESWSEAIARPLLHTPDTILNVATAFYFVSFVVLCAVILINVVVAVLLEKMVDDGTPPEEDSDESSEGGGSESTDGAKNKAAQDDIAIMKRDLNELKDQVSQILKVVHGLADATGNGNLRGAADSADAGGEGGEGIRPPSASSRQPPGDDPEKISLPGEIGTGA